MHTSQHQGTTGGTEQVAITGVQFQTEPTACTGEGGAR